jgi:hypothetical protein
MRKIFPRQDAGLALIRALSECYKYIQIRKYITELNVQIKFKTENPDFA